MPRLVPLATLLAFAACTPDVDQAPPTATYATPQSANLVVYPDPLVAETVAVVVRDARGKPMAGAYVVWSSQGDGATVDAIDAVSDSLGVARAAWHPGGWLGRQEVYATVEALPKLTISAEARSYSLRYLVGNLGSVCGLNDAGVLYCVIRTSASRSLRTPANGSERYAAIAFTGEGDGSGAELCAARVAGGIDCFAPPQSGSGPMAVTHSFPGVPPLVWLAGANTEAGFCGLTTDGVMWCWGRNRRGRFGDGFDGAWPNPAPLNSPLRLTSVRLGTNHACGITISREVWCWGDNAEANLGLPIDSVAPRMPTKVPNLGPSAELAINGVGATCARGDDALVRCWGPQFGTGLGLGYGLGPARGFPVLGPVLRLNAASALRGIQIGFVGLAQDGELYIWARVSGGTGQSINIPTSMDLHSRLMELEFSDISDVACGRTVSGGTLCLDVGQYLVEAVMAKRADFFAKNLLWAIPEPKP